MSDTSTQRNQQLELVAYANELDKDDLARLTNEMIDNMLAMIGGCTDADVVLVPDDPEAYDEFADTVEEVDLAWTLGHVIVHTTASAEEAAFLAAELARGVSMRVRRSRAEVPWERVTTIAQCRERLEESRRMRLASLAMWPDQPDLENHYIYRKTDVPINAKTRFMFGLMHDESHVEQIAEIVRQAKAARAV